MNARKKRRGGASSIILKETTTHAGDRVAERHHLGVPAPVDPDVVKEVRQVPLEPPSAVLHEGGRRVPRPPGVLLGARGERGRGRGGGLGGVCGGGAGGEGDRGGGGGGARAPWGRKLRRGRGRARRRRRGQSSTNSNRGAAAAARHLRRRSRPAEPRRRSESVRPLDQESRGKRPTLSGHRRSASARGRRTCAGHGDHHRWILSS